jgi:hypothetical protein
MAILPLASNFLSTGTAPRCFDNSSTWLHVIVMALRRIGPDPHLDGQQTPGLHGCPDIFELENGDFAIVGRDVTSEVAGELPPGATCGPDERIIAIPRKTLVLAKTSIPENLL